MITETRTDLVPVLVQRWMSVGESWAYHPSLGAELVELIARIRTRIQVNSHQPANTQTPEVNSSIVELEPNMRFAVLLQELDNDTPDPLAKTRNAPIWRIAILPRDFSIALNQDRIDALCQKIREYTPTTPGEDPAACVSNFEFQVNAGSSKSKIKFYQRKGIIMAGMAATVTCILLATQLGGSSAPMDSWLPKPFRLRIEPEENRPLDDAELSELHRQLNPFFLASIPSDKVEMEAAVRERLKLLTLEFSKVEASTDNIRILWKDSGLRKQVATRLRTMSQRQGQIPLDPSLPNRDFVLRMDRMREQLAAIRTLVTQGANTDLKLSKHDPTISLIKRLSQTPSSASLSKGVSNTNPALRLAYPDDSDFKMLEWLSSNLTPLLGESGLDGLIEEVEFHASQSKRRGKPTQIYDATLELLIAYRAQMSTQTNDRR